MFCNVSSHMCYKTVHYSPYQPEHVDLLGLEKVDQDHLALCHRAHWKVDVCLCRVQTWQWEETQWIECGLGSECSRSRTHHFTWNTYILWNIAVFIHELLHGWKIFQILFSKVVSIHLKFNESEYMVEVIINHLVWSCCMNSKLFIFEGPG